MVKFSGEKRSSENTPQICSDVFEESKFCVIFFVKNFLHRGK